MNANACPMLDDALNLLSFDIDKTSAFTPDTLLLKIISLLSAKPLTTCLAYALSGDNANIPIFDKINTYFLDLINFLIGLYEYR